MVCPNCGNVLSDNSTNCFACGSPIINPNVQPLNNNSANQSINNVGQIPPTNQPVNNAQNTPPMDNNSIAVPQDFVLAGGSDDTDVANDLPDSMLNLLNKEEDKQKKPEKKKRKGKYKKIIRIVLTILVIISLGIFGYNVYLGYTSPSYDLSCSTKRTENGIVGEYTYQYTLSDQGYINAFETMKIYHENLMPFTETDLNNQLANLGSVGYNRTGSLEEGKIVISYYVSYYDVKSISEVSTAAIADGFTCEVPKSVGIKLPFLN